MIKRLEAYEIEEVMQIWLKTNIVAHNFINKEYWIKNYTIVKNQYLPIAETFLYKEDNIIKGFISIIDGNFIGALFVLEEYQRRGIGKDLINYCKSIYKSLSLSVYKDNRNSIEFYKFCGFRIIKERVNEDSGLLEYEMRF